MELVHIDLKTLTQNRDIGDFLLISYWKSDTMQLTKSRIIRNIDARPLIRIQDNKPIYDTVTLETLEKLK